MFMGYEESLKHYINVHIEEWVNRGFKNTMIVYTVKESQQPIFIMIPSFTVIIRRLCTSKKSNEGNRLGTAESGRFHQSLEIL